MQRLALFDLDGTLIDRAGAFHAWAAEFVDTHALEHGALDKLAAADARNSGTMRSFFAEIRDTFGVAAPVDELWEQYRRRMPELSSCRRDDLEALKRLRAAGWRIGIVTNGMADNQLGKIRHVGLDKVADAWCISGEVGIRKPDPEIFRLGAQRCGLTIDNGGWMIGDDLESDIAGGRAAGLGTIWINSAVAPLPEIGCEPDFTARSVASAVEILVSVE